MDIAETFLSIQGEGPRTGRSCFFVRTAGCNLNCRWCDTVSVARGCGSEMSPDVIVDLCATAFGHVPRGDFKPLVCVTGGEPTLQPDMPELLDKLVDAGFDIDLMTNGTTTLDEVPLQVALVMDVKIFMLAGGWTPPSMCGPVWTRPGESDAVKFVVTSRNEFDLAAAWAGSHGLFSRVGSVFVAPAWGLLEPSALAGWIIDAEPRFRLGLQTHKYVWGADTRM